MMREKVFSWRGREFVLLSAEGTRGAHASEQTLWLFADFTDELSARGFSLENTVRTRLWARDRESRDLASRERSGILSGGARSASSSYIAPDHFTSAAHIAIDLLAMKPGQSDARKVLREYDPPRVPLRYLIHDSFIFLSGVTAILPTLTEQVDEIVGRITCTLQEADVSWDKVLSTSFYLHRDESVDVLRELFGGLVNAVIPQTEFVFVDGYSAKGKLLEIEVTAWA